MVSLRRQLMITEIVNRRSSVSVVRVRNYRLIRPQWCDIYSTMLASSTNNSMDSKPAQKEILLKFLVIGDYGVGKTAIVRRYTDGHFSSNYKITIGADFSVKSVQWDPETKLTLQLWDIAGHERYGCMTRVYYKYAVGAIIVFDVSRIATFHSIGKWLRDVREKVLLPDGSNIPIVVLANKCDIPGVNVPSDIVARFCREAGVSAWFATSAKTDININEAIKHLAQQALLIRSREIHRDSIFLGQNEKEEEKACC